MQNSFNDSQSSRDEPSEIKALECSGTSDKTGQRELLQIIEHLVLWYEKCFIDNHVKKEIFLFSEQDKNNFIAIWLVLIFQLFLFFNYDHVRLTFCLTLGLALPSRFPKVCLLKLEIVLIQYSIITHKKNDSIPSSQMQLF